MNLPLIYSVVILIVLQRKASALCWYEDLHVYENGDCTLNTLCEVDLKLLILPFCHITSSRLRIQNATMDFFSDYNTTGFGDFVTSIKAVDNNWTSITPLAFSFPFSTYIDLSNNGIKFVHEDAFLHATYLSELNLSRNAIEALDRFSFAVSDNLSDSNVSVLDLSHNSLSYIPEGSMHYLPNLRKLYLDYNKLEYVLDGTFINMKSLLVLSLSYNLLTSIITMLVGLRHLEELYLSFNKLKYLHDYELTDGISLKIMNVSHNSLEALDFNAFNSTNNLQTLDLSHNKIKSPISIFNKTKLRYLNLCNNSIMTVDYEFASSTNGLEEIDFSLNNISVYPAGLFSAAENLKILNLSSNMLSHLSNESFINKNVIVLDLSKNELSDIDANAFKDSVNLKKLILDFNLIKKIDFNLLTSFVPKLRELSIGRNQIPCKKVSEYYSKGLKLGVNVTAVQKVFNDDNVHGISCDALRSMKKKTFFTETLTWTMLMVLFIVILITAGVWSAITNKPKSPPPIPLTNFSDHVEMSEMEEQSNL